MTMLSMRTHPSEETLSRLADQSEIERARSRAGRHAARCEQCRETIAGFHALGEAARRMPAPALPPLLGQRIAARRDSGVAVGAPLMNVDAPAGEAGGRTMRHWSTKKRSAIAVAAAAIVLAALVGPAWRRHVLAAAAPGQATMFPRYPRPGATVGIRFAPSADWVGGDTLWLSGLIDLRIEPRAARWPGPVSVSTPMLRDRDGAYRGRIVLPAGARSGALAIVTDPEPGPRTRRVARLLVLTADSSGERPSLDALESAVYNDRSFMAEETLYEAFTRWAPGHPMRWLVDVSRARHGPFDWLAFFTSGERRFARLTTQLNARKNVRPAELAGMAELAYSLEEPEAAAEWTNRLIREHPADPWTITLRAKQIHEMELRGAPDDSIARLIPSLDTLYALAHGSTGDLYSVIMVVRSHADSATQRRWALRAARAGSYLPSDFFGRQAMLRDPEMQDSVEAFAREVLGNRATPPSRSSASALTDFKFDLAHAYSYLASIALARHQYRAALALTDSARFSECIAIGQDTRALALLALGDTVAAIPYLAPFGTNRVVLTPDSARALLGSHYDPRRWQQAVDSVAAVRETCRHQRR
jgi:hypothetical protein